RCGGRVGRWIGRRQEPSPERPTQVGTMTQSYKRIVGLGAAGALLFALVLSAAGQPPSDEARQLAEKAQEQALAKKYDQAAATIKKALQLEPRNDLYLARASLYEMKDGKYAAGFEYA